MSKSQRLEDLLDKIQMEQFYLVKGKQHFQQFSQIYHQFLTVQEAVNNL